MALDTIKCPHCGYMYQMDLAKYKQNRETIFTRGIFGKDKSKLESSNLIDLKCPNSACGKSFEWEVK
jgi:hypothetical protein